MDDMNFYNKHYITVDERGRILVGFSDAFRQPSNKDICIDEQGSYQFRLFPGGEENPALFDFTHDVPLYKYENGKVVKRSQEDVDADIAVLPTEEEVPSQLDMLEAQVTYTAMMTDTLLEV